MFEEAKERIKYLDTQVRLTYYSHFEDLKLYYVFDNGYSVELINPNTSVCGDDVLNVDENSSIYLNYELDLVVYKDYCCDEVISYDIDEIEEELCELIYIVELFEQDNGLGYYYLHLCKNENISYKEYKSASYELTFPKEINETNHSIHYSISQDKLNEIIEQSDVSEFLLDVTRNYELGEDDKKYMQLVCDHMSRVNGDINVYYDSL